MTIEEFKSFPKDSEYDQKFITALFTELTNSIPKLKEFRDKVEKEVWGFGERAFLSMYKMILESVDSEIDILPKKCLEIGVYKGQILVAWKIISEIIGMYVDVYGITPLDSTDGHIESDYLNDIHRLHDYYGCEYPKIIKGQSQDPNIVSTAKKNMPYDVLFIDGHHGYEEVKEDLRNYPQMVKKGGYLIIDDSANYIKGTYWGAFWGIESVSKAVDELLPPKTQNNDWEYIGNVVHNRIWRRIN